MLRYLNKKNWRQPLRRMYSGNGNAFRNLSVIVVLFVGAISLFNTTTETNRTTLSEPLANWMQKFGVKALEKPRAIPNIRFQNSEGNEVSLQHLPPSERLILIWATWCSPCREEVPYFNRIIEELKSQGIQLIPISVDEEGVAKVKQFYESHRIDNLPLYNDSGISTLETLNIGPIPTLIVVDKRGYEIGRRTGKLPNI